MRKREFFEIVRAIISHVDGTETVQSEESLGRFLSLKKAQEAMLKAAEERDGAGLEDPYYMDDDTIMMFDENDTEVEYTVRLRRR